MKKVFDIQADRILADLQDCFLEHCEDEGVHTSRFEEVADHQFEAVLLPEIEINLDDVDFMISAMEYEDFEEWFFEFYDLDGKASWIEKWSEEMCKNVYKNLKDRK